MSKFLNETGLSYFWTKVKAFIKSKYVAIGDNIDIEEDTCKTHIESAIVDLYDKNDKFRNNIAADGIVLSQNDIDSTFISSTSIELKLDAQNHPNDGTFITNNNIELTSDENTISINPQQGIAVSSNISADGTITSKSNVTGDKIVKSGGTNVQVLLADGSIATLNAANGIPKLDANGRIPLSQLGNLDTTLFQVVTALPTTGIKKNRIYLLKSSSTTTQNLYSEYVYTGDVSATYDASKWEKLGEYKADIDLTPYSKKTETIRTLRSVPAASKVDIQASIADGNVSTTTLAAATQSAAGVMQASDKKALDTLTARYPLSIASFTASPSLVEVGVAADITFAWTFNNTDFHPITAQGIVVDGAASVAVDKATKTYKKTALAGATTATTKSATLTVNGSLTKSVNVTYHYPTYIGVVANGTSITETVVKGLTKSIEWGRGKTATLTQSNQQIVYAYPATYGDLTSIKDGNGFEGFAGYTKSTLTVGGQTYNVYKQNLPATASSKYTFA